MSFMVATRTARVVGNAALSARTIIADNSSGLILGIYVANTDDAAEDTVNFQGAGGTNLATLEVSPNDTENITTPFLVNDGFVVVSTGGVATTIVTVFYRPDA